MSLAVIDTNTMDLDTTPVITSADSNMMESVSEQLVCPDAPRKRARSPSEIVEAEAYDAVVRKLADELTVRLDTLPPLDGLMSASGLQRQQAVDHDVPPTHSPIVLDSPVTEMLNGVDSTEINLPETVDSDTESETGEVSDDDADDEGGDEGVSVSVSVSESDEEEETEAEAEAEPETIEHVEDTNTNGVYLSLHHRKGTGELTMRLEAPVWMLGLWMAVVTAYMWMTIYMIKR